MPWPTTPIFPLLREAFDGDQLQMTPPRPSPKAEPALAQRGWEETTEERVARILKIREEKRLKQVVAEKRKSLKQRCGMEEEDRRRAKQKSTIATYFACDDPRSGKRQRDEDCSEEVMSLVLSDTPGSAMKTIIILLSSDSSGSETLGRRKAHPAWDPLAARATSLVQRLTSLLIDACRSCK
jgi:hypothetical protein